MSLTTRILTANHWRWAYAVTVVLLCNGLPDRAAAQGTFAPRVHITPGDSNFNRYQQVTVTAEYCSQYPLNLSSERILLNGDTVRTATSVTPSWADCAWQYRAARQFTTRLGIGETIVIVKVENDLDGDTTTDDGWLGQANVRYWTPPPVYGVAVQAGAQFIDAHTTGASQTQSFTVTNTSDDSVTIGVSCTWSLASGCTTNPATIGLARGASGTVIATHAAVTSTATPGLVSFSASVGDASDSTWVEITLHPTTATPGVVLVNPNGERDQSLCVTLAAGPGAASECGDLRLAHALPAVRTKNKLRAPTLLYNSRTAQPSQLIPADFTLPETYDLTDSVVAFVNITAGPAAVGSSYAAGRWRASDWGAANVTRRITASFDAGALPTGVYSYSLELYRHAAAGFDPGDPPDSASGTFIVVNRNRSELGAGWSLAGLERLYFPTQGGLLWVDGDGSARLYPATGSCAWRARDLDRPDSITSTCAGQASRYTRWLPNRVRVVFDSAGRHRYTVNSIGDTTEFRYDASGRLSQVLVPPRPASTVGRDTLRYTFYYSGSSFVDSVWSPGLAPSGRRLTRATRVTGRVVQGASGARLLSLTDPDGSVIRFHYANERSGQGDYWVTSRVGRIKDSTVYGYGAGQVLASSSTPNGSTPYNLTFRTAEALGAPGATGAGTAIDPDSIYTMLTGPRTGQATKWWINALGAPVRLRNALGQETKVVYDARWPVLPASVTSPTRLVTTAAYDSLRGLLLTRTVKNVLGDGRDATTTYKWDSRFEHATMVRGPDSVTTWMQYDSLGLRLWQQVGHDSLDSSRRVTFAYDPVTHLLVSDSLPLGQKETFAYDTLLLNLEQTKTPIGFLSLTFYDALGRDTLTVTPIDSGPALARSTLLTNGLRTRKLYDDADRVWHTETIGPERTGCTLCYNGHTPPQTLIVESTFDSAGRVLQVKRKSVPDAAHVDSVVTTWTYDKLGRMLSEQQGSDVNQIAWVYDAAGNATTKFSRRDPNRIFSTYDLLDRLTQKVIPRVTYPLDTATLDGQFYFDYPSYGTNVIPADTLRFTYDAGGNLTRADNLWAKIRRGYGTSGLLLTDKSVMKQWVPSANDHTYEIQHGYDVAGRRIWDKHPTNLVANCSGTSVLCDSTAYGYDAETGALITLRDVLGNQYAYHYDRNGQIDTVRYPGAVSLAQSYDDDGRVMRRLGSSPVDAHASTPSPMRDETLTYDASGKILEAYDWPNMTGGNHTSLRYTALGQVAASYAQAYGNAFVTHENWEYDALGNTVLNCIDCQNGWGVLRDVYSYQSGTARLLMMGTQNIATTSPDTTVNEFDASGNISHARELRYNWAKATSTSNGDASYLYIGWGSGGRACATCWDMIDGGTYQPGQTSLRASDVFSYYDADERLRVVEKSYAKVPLNMAPHVLHEEYRYDALGRRIAVRSRNLRCPSHSCRDTMTRTVWDGSQILYELRTPGDDSATVNMLEAEGAYPSTWYQLYAPLYGRVGYVYGVGGVDQPVGIVRYAYGNFPGGGSVPSPLLLVPHYNFQGQPDNGTFGSGMQSVCSGTSNCILQEEITWSALTAWPLRCR